MTDALTQTHRSWMLAYLVAGFTALLIGASFGPLQALNYAGFDAYPHLAPVIHTYYQGLTVHGVMNAYAFTFFVSCGLLVYLPAAELGLAPDLKLWRAAFLLMAAGTALVLASLFSDTASVLWTFYPPLRASAPFYLGMTLIALGSVLPVPILLDLRRRWRARNPGKLTPLVTYMSLATMLMWGLASLGLLAELLLQLDPWSLGLIGTVDPIVGRTLFWLTGHPIVYFWLMPAYVSWYGLLPAQIGGKLVSDPMARLSFVLLLVFSLPVGTHHQFDDPGFSPIWRGILVALTMSVALPSLLTAFTIGLTLEHAGRLRGGTGPLGWFAALPWRKPEVAAQLLAAITFVVGGATGIVQGSWQLDNVVHNTTFLPGHFHLTVGTVVAMTFMSVAFWMLPHLTGRRLISPNTALAGVWLWFAGMSLMATGLLAAGLQGVPRRDWIANLPRSDYLALFAPARAALLLTGAGGILLAAALVLFYAVFFGTLLVGKRGSERPPIPFATAFGGPESVALHLPLAPGHPTPVGLVAAPTLSPLARTLEPLGALAAFTAVATLAAYLPILWPFLAHWTRAPGWVVW